LPLPAVNVPLRGYEVDFLWPDARFVVEADGGEHLNRAQRDRTTPATPTSLGPATSSAASRGRRSATAPQWRPRSRR
jgi:hypothetical protein